MTEQDANALQAEFDRVSASLYANETPAVPEKPQPDNPADAPEPPVSPSEAVDASAAPPVAPTGDTPLEERTEAPTALPTQEEVDFKAEWDKLHPKVREQIEQERRASQSAIGRVAFLNSQLDKLKNELGSGKAVQPQVHLPPANESPADKKVRLDKLEKLRETDPEYAATIDEMLAELDRRHVEDVSKWQQQVSPLQQQTRELELRLEEQTMDMHAPDWRDAVRSNAFQEWQHFKLPPDERAALGTYTRAKDLLPYINAFKQDWAAYQAANQQQESAPVTPPQADTTHADKVAQDRAKKLQTASVGPTSVPKPPSKPIDLADPEVMRKEFERVSKELYKT